MKPSLANHYHACLQKFRLQLKSVITAVNMNAGSVFSTNSIFHHKAGRALAMLLCCSFILSLASGQIPNQSPPKASEPVKDEMPQTASQTGHELTADDVEAFLDGIVPLQLEREDIAGATVAIVKDGKLLFAKGYGFADVEEKKAVSAKDTLFRPGSISKLFTWTAVMQLAEQGKLDLDRDINEYLDFKIPEAFGKPITLRNLLTHTPGFEEQIKDLIYFNGSSPNLGDYLKTHIPARIYPPGTVPAYSNYGTALAGYIVERVSGEPFEQYVEKHIFRPLEMTNSSFAQPLPANLAPNMSKGYKLASAKPMEFEIIGPFPAGSLSTTAEDIAKFMLAHLQKGQYGSSQILRPETAELMHSRLFALDPSANAMAYGFYEENRNGRRIIGHGGDTIAFHSDLHLILDSGVGFFISYNSAGRGQASPRSIIWDAFLNRYFPADGKTPAALESAKQDAAAVSGTYKSSRRPENSLFKAVNLIGGTNVTASEDGTITVDSFLAPNGKPKTWREVGPMVFQEVDGSDKLIFKPDENGTLQMILPYPFMVSQRVSFWENSRILLPVLVFSLVVMLLTLIFWFVGWLIRRHYSQRLDLTRKEFWLRILVRLVFALCLIFTAAIFGLIVYGLSNLDFLSSRGIAWFRIAQIIGLIATAGTLVVFYNLFDVIKSSRFRIWGKLQAIVFVLACIGFLWFVFAGNLLSFASNF
jgi:CubicO group peptidase (beta-lactamase class C family)